MRNREVLKISLIFIGLSVTLSVLAISFEIAPQKEPEVRNTQIKVTTDSVAITTEAFDVSGVYSVVAIIKDSQGKEVKRLILSRGEKLSDKFYIYKASFLKKELLYGEYSMDIVATDWLGYKEEKFNQGAVEIIKLLDSAVFYLIDQKGNKDGILNMVDYTEEVKNAEGLIATYGGEAKVIFKTIESYEGTRVKLGEFKCPDFDRNNILNIFDLAKIGITFGTREGEPKYNPDYDINNDKIIDASELSIIALYFNQAPTDFLACIPPIAENQKDLSKYSLKEVFLISDQNWQDVLSLVPITIWTDQDGTIHKYPTLIYHEEEALLPFVSIGYMTGQVLDIPDGAWQSFVALDDFVSKVKVGGGFPGQTYYLQLQDSGGNIIANSESFAPSLYYETHEFVFDVNINKGELYKIIWKVKDKINIYVFYSSNSYQSGEYSRNNNYDLQMKIYGDDLTPGFDADSIIYFLKQYQSKKVTTIGGLPGELTGWINGEFGLIPEMITVYDCFSYWNSFKDVVYVENNYELALMASTYASLINAPLIIQGTSLDSLGVLYGRDVILVGNITCPLGASCPEKYTLDQLQKKYVEKTNTDKIILVNPNDLNIKVTETFYPEKSSGSIFELYSKTSLAAPILASAKHELIISTTSTDYQAVDSFIENKISSLGINPEYLTIIASPDAIEMSYENPFQQNNYISTDAWFYSKLNDGDDLLDLAVGRIFGITISDTSSNIARAIFYQETLKNPDKILVTRGFPTITMAAEVYAVGEALSSIGYQPKVTPDKTTPGDWVNKFFISYNDHGGYSWAGISSEEIPYLDNSFIITYACSTCDFKESSLKGALFCAHAIRKGAIGYIGAIDAAGFINQQGLLAEIFAAGDSVGKSFIIAKNSVMVYDNNFVNNWSMPWYTLIGDPTLKLPILHQFPELRFNLLSQKPTSKDYELILSAIKITIPQWVINLCEYPAAVVPLNFTTAFNRQLNLENKFTVRFELPEGFDPNSISPAGWRIKKEIHKGKEYLWITSPYHYGGYFPYTFLADYTFNIILSE